MPNGGKIKSDINSHHLYSSRQDELQYSTSQNPYKLKEAKEIFAREDQMISSKSRHSTPQEEEIKRVTKLFCDWVSSLVSPHYSRQTCIQDSMSLH